MATPIRLFSFYFSKKDIVRNKISFHDFLLLFKATLYLFIALTEATIIGCYK